jgi:hypothetical protein
MAADAKHIPILCIDVQGFTTHNTETQRTIVRRLQRMATEAARFFMPYGDPWTKWQRQGTGDGYYFPFDALSPQVALQYALNLEAALTAHNAQHGQDLVLRLYGALVLGDVELVGDQYLSAAFSEAARFLSHQPFKDALERQERPMVLAMSSLFHSEWRDDIERENTFPEAAALQWTPFRFRDKHSDEHQGYVLGPGWEQDVAVPADTTADVKPAPVSDKAAMPAGSSAGATNRRDAVDTLHYTGEVKLNFCRRLGPSWQDLADCLNIPPFERASFERGREPQGVWEWLEARQRLVELPQALAAIGRDDLLEVLPHPPQ